jgi:D-3-phosphoglycerate dehydrogenase / 2-oxoglutarate reductase
MTNSILIIDEVHPSMIEIFESAGITYEYQPDLDRAKALAIIGNFQGVILRSKILADKEFIDAGRNLKVIGRTGAGMETIDIPYAESKGIACINSPEGNRDAVGEQAIGMLLSLMNNLNKADAEVRNLQWDREGNRGIELNGRTVGIIGYGNMGGAFAKKLSGFDVEVIAYDKYKTNYGNLFAKEVFLDELFERADIISLHVPQTAETIEMVNDSFLAKCKKNIIIINTARGKVVKTDDLVKHLKTGHVIATALDVLEYESFNFQDFLNENMPEAFNYLAQSKNVLLTPHIAGWTVESKRKLSSVLAEKIVKHLQKN